MKSKIKFFKVMSITKTNKGLVYIDSDDDHDVDIIIDCCEGNYRRVFEGISKVMGDLGYSHE